MAWIAWGDRGRRSVGGGRFRLTTALAATGLVAGAAMYAVPLLAVNASVSTSSGFDAADGDLAAGTAFDWNSFGSPTWTGTDPYQTTTATDATTSWALTGLHDAAVSGTDSGFAGGVKQDNACGTTKPGKAPNKDDLKRIYLSTKRAADGTVYLNLAWVRIPQNTTSASAHVGFEFNQGTDVCANAPAVRPRLVQRTGGDMLIVYDFEGGTTTPQLKLSRWLTTDYWNTLDPLTRTGCEVNNSTIAAGCWGNTTELTALGYAEGKVSTGTVTDGLKLTGDTNPGPVEFGEAGIDLTASGVFGAGRCTNFGNAYAVSRSSGNSTQAAMEDIVGPGTFSVSNCGSITFLKQDDLGNSLPGAWFQLWKDLATDVVYSRATTIAGTAGATLPVGTTALSVDDGSFLPSVGAFKLVLDSGGPAEEEVTVLSRSGDALTLLPGTTKAHDVGAGALWNGTCSPSGAVATCTIPSLPFGDYLLKETSPPAGYNAADDRSFTISPTQPTGGGPLTFTDSRAPIDLVVNKKDDNGVPMALCATATSTNCPRFSLYEDATPTGAPFQPVTLPASPTTTTLTAPISATDTSVLVTSATGFNVGAYAELANGSTKEHVKITAKSGNTLTVVRGLDGTNAAPFVVSGTTVAAMTGTDAFLKNCVAGVTGQCTISTVYPGSYWVDESQVPTGYAKASGLPLAVVVALGDATPRTLSDGTNDWFTDPRLFKVITLVCRKSDSTLYGSGVTYDSGTAQTSLMHGATLPGGLTEAQLCGLGGATHDDVQKGAHSAAIAIPSVAPTPGP